MYIQLHRRNRAEPVGLQQHRCGAAADRYSHRAQVRVKARRAANNTGAENRSGRANHTNLCSINRPRRRYRTGPCSSSAQVYRHYRTGWYRYRERRSGIPLAIGIGSQECDPHGTGVRVLHIHDLRTGGKAQYGQYEQEK